jgi:hypothetical protein
LDFELHLLSQTRGAQDGGLAIRDRIRETPGENAALASAGDANRR